MRSHGIRLDPKSNENTLMKGRTEQTKTGEFYVKMEAEIGMMHIQAKDTKKARRGMGRILPECLQKKLSLPTLRFCTFNLWNCGKNKFLLF